MSQEHHSTPALTAIDGSASYPQLPQNIEAEQAVLGALLVNNDAAGKIGDFLLADHFYEPAHQRIYDAALRLIERNQLANPVTLKHYFEQDQTLSEVGGAQYLVRLASSAVTVYNVEHYARVVHDLALRRSLMDIGDEMLHDAGDADIDDDATPYTGRKAGYYWIVASGWDREDDDARVVAWSRMAGARLAEISMRGNYVNEQGDFGKDIALAAYGEKKYSRLAKLKARYDPSNLFHLNQNIEPKL